MQWGQIKTLFILSFLILDLFLLSQFLEKQNQQDISGAIQTDQEESITDRLESYNIKINEEILNQETPEVEPVTSSGVQFSEEILAEIEELQEGDAQFTQLKNDSIFTATLMDPVEVTEETMIETVNDLVPFADQYSYWGWLKEEGVALFFQTVNDRTIYYHPGGVLAIHTEGGKITGYGATMISFPSSQNEANTDPEPITPVITIIRELFETGLLEPGDTVTDAEVGYYTATNLYLFEDIGAQIFGPHWKITVDKGDEVENYFVVNGEVRDINQSDDFVNEVKTQFSFTANEDGTETAQIRPITQTGVSME